MIVFADKTSNIYKLNTDEYKNLTTEALTSTYEKVSDKINSKVNTEVKRIMENKTALDRIFINSSNNCVITLKDHKETFFLGSENNTPFEKIATIWQRKHVDEKRGDLFDAAMAVCDGAEVCELVGTFLLEKIREICNESDIGSYRDGGLATFRDKSSTQLEKIKKKFQRLFKEYDLEITVESNQKIVNYLDVTLNFKDSALLDLTINPVTKCSTYIRNPITPQIISNIYQPL